MPGHETGRATMIVVLIQLDDLIVTSPFKSLAPSSLDPVQLGLLGLK